jgi:hypothetical protein
MASSTITLKDEADANVVYTLVGQTADGAVYRNAAAPLGLPQGLTFSIKLGVPGSKSNDRIDVKLHLSVENSETGLVSTGTAKISLSLPRDSAWTEQMSQDIMIQLQDLFSDANAILIADGLVP